MKKLIITTLLFFVYSNNILAESPMSKALYNSINRDTFCLKVHKHCLTDEAKKNWVFKNADAVSYGLIQSRIKSKWKDLFTLNLFCEITSSPNSLGCSRLAGILSLPSPWSHKFDLLLWESKYVSR